MLELMGQVGIILVQLLTLIFGNFFCTLFGVCKHSNFQFVCKHFFLLQIWLKYPRSQASHPYLSKIFTFIKLFFLIRNVFLNIQYYFNITSYKYGLCLSYLWQVLHHFWEKLEHQYTRKWLWNHWCGLIPREQDMSHQITSPRVWPSPMSSIRLKLKKKL